MSIEDKEKEIQGVKDFINARYPNADLSKLVIRFSLKKLMDIVAVGKGNGKTKIILDNGRDFQKSFLKLQYVKNALGESFDELRAKKNEEIYKERQRLIESERLEKEFFEVLENADKTEKTQKENERKKRIEKLQRDQEKIKESLGKKEREKKAKEKKFYETKQLEVMNEREKEVKQKN